MTEEHKENVEEQSFEIGRMTGLLDGLFRRMGRVEEGTDHANEQLEGVIRRLDKQNGTVADLVAFKQRCEAPLDGQVPCRLVVADLVAWRKAQQQAVEAAQLGKRHDLSARKIVLWGAALGLGANVIYLFIRSLVDHLLGWNL